MQKMMIAVMVALSLALVSVSVTPALADSTIETSYGVPANTGRTARVDTNEPGTTSGIPAPKSVKGEPATTTAPNFAGAGHDPNELQAPGDAVAGDAS